MKKFFMVFVEGKSAPAVKHYEIGPAMMEAERLAKINGKTAYVLEAVSSCRLNDVKWERPTEDARGKCPVCHQDDCGHR